MTWQRTPENPQEDMARGLPRQRRLLTRQGVRMLSWRRLWPGAAGRLYLPPLPKQNKKRSASTCHALRDSTWRPAPTSADVAASGLPYICTPLPRNPNPNRLLLRLHSIFFLSLCLSVCLSVSVLIVTLIFLLAPALTLALALAPPYPNLLSTLWCLPKP